MVMRWIPEWLRAPEFEDMEKTRKASLLHVILLFSLMALLANGLIAVITIPAYGVIYALINTIIGVALVLFYWLNQRGRVDLSIWLTTGVFWAAMVVGTFPFVGIYDPYVGSFVFVIIMASLLINSLVSFAYTALTIIAGFVWIAFQLPPYQQLINVWLAFSFIFTLTAFLMWLAQRGIQRVVVQLQEKEQQLKHQNQALAREITERLNAEMDLRQHEMQSRRLLEVIPMAVVVVDANATLLYLNPGGIQLAGTDEVENLIGTSLYTFLPDLPPDFLKSTNTIRHSVTHSAAQKRDVEIRSAPFDFQHQRAHLLLITDLTAQRRIEQDRMEAEKLRIQMEEERKLLKLRDSFAAMVSHEFRTPLTVIQSSHDMLTKYHHRLTSEKRDELLSRIKQQVKRMTQLLEDILVFSQFDAEIKQAQMQPLHLDHVWESLLDEVKLVYPEHQFQTAFEASDILGLWDESLLRHVLLNLMTNAAKYSPIGSTIHCALYYEGDQAVLKVSDRGRGIPAKDQPRLFQPFMRASNVKKSSGTGLGLVIVKKSVEAHGGTIQFKSIEDEGTTFTVYLPFTAAAVAAKTAN